MQNPLKIILNGIFKENPTFALVLGMCPTIAVTTSAENGLSMGLAAMCVLIGSNIAISALRRIIPDEIRIPAFIVVIAGFVTVLQLVIAAWFPALDAKLGIFIPLIVVNCIILARAEAFASKNGILASAADGLGMGLGFTLALIVIGGVREIVGAGTFFGLNLFGGLYEPALLAILAPGGFITLGILMGIFRQFQLRKEAKADPAAACAYDGWNDLSACAGCAMAAACRKAQNAAAETEKDGDAK
ncbi:MAG: electron transport complex subunit E [Pyramidobacter sp.]|nr:electron transport complex subunit E [Pyramidobacter sp.]MBP3751980.1 electron transport complex subunit E [Pyramidobacter sp.]